MLEQKLYKSNFKTEECRYNILYSLHASLTKHKDVPSFYISYDNIDLQKLIDKVLLSDILDLNNFNSLNVKSLNISQKYFYSLTHEDKVEIIEMIEDILSNGLGKGYIHYERLRLIPCSDCNLSNIIKSNDKNLNYNLLLNKLHSRLFEANRYLNQINNFFSQGERNYHPSVISKSYSLLMEKSWKNSWMSRVNYLCNDLPSNIILLEDI